MKIVNSMAENTLKILRHEQHNILKLYSARLLVIFEKRSILDVWQTSEYASGGSFLQRL